MSTKSPTVKPVPAANTELTRTDTNVVDGEVVSTKAAIEAQFKATHEPATRIQAEIEIGVPASEVKDAVVEFENRINQLPTESEIESKFAASLAAEKPAEPKATEVPEIFDAGTDPLYLNTFVRLLDELHAAPSLVKKLSVTGQIRDFMNKHYVLRSSVVAVAK